MKFDTEEVALYLKEHPEFLEQHAALLAEIYMPHPHGGRAISIAERQQLALRDKNKVLENKLLELVQFGEQNDAIGDKVHYLSLALIMADGMDPILEALYFSLREHFDIHHVALRFWTGASEYFERIEFAEVGAEVRLFAEELNGPYCGPEVPEEVAGWFGEAAPQLESFAAIPLRSEHAFGLLVLASDGQEQRFYPEMGTLYLQRISELLSVALLPHLSHDKHAA